MQVYCCVVAICHFPAAVEGHLNGADDLQCDERRFQFMYVNMAACFVCRFVYLRLFSNS